MNFPTKLSKTGKHLFILLLNEQLSSSLVKLQTSARCIDNVDVTGQGQPIRINFEIFKDKVKNGFYIEAGAYDGERESNSLFYEMKKGWNGLLVEPDPKSFENLLMKVCICCKVNTGWINWGRRYEFVI